MRRLFPKSVSVKYIAFCALILFCAATVTEAVTSKITSHKTAQDFLKGKAENIIISSKGTLQLGRKWQRLTEDFNDVWSINSIVQSGGKIYFGTSPNGGIYRYSLGQIEEIYSARDGKEAQDTAEPNENKDDDANAISSVKSTDEPFANEHIFAMATDISGRLLAAISGRRCALCRLEGGRLEEIFSPEDAKYIFAVTVSDDGTIFLGTGPEGKIYRLDSSGKNAKVVYDSSDKNILSLAVADDGTLLAGSDTRGLVYKIEPDSGQACVLYDSEQDEVTAVLTVGEDIYAAATSAQVVQAQRQFARQVPLAGRPEKESESDSESGSSGGSMRLNIANTNTDGDKDERPERPRPQPTKAGQVSYVYKISPEGFVTEVFSEAAVLFNLAVDGPQLVLGTGNEAELFTIDPAAEKSAVIYKDKSASQITAVSVAGGDIYVGTANPARLIKIAAALAEQGTYTSSLIDASQPAKWGKLQIEADIPPDSKVMAASRSGNVADVNDPTFSEWTEPVEVTAPVQLRCPVARYCQYKLLFTSSDGLQSPVVREVAVAETIPNLAPEVREVTVERIDKPEKQGHYEIKYKAEDDNQDTLIYRIDFRKLGRQSWIELADDVEQPSYEWDGRTVEDGRYEVKVTASDARSNSAESAKEASRVSDPVVIDNTPPEIHINSVASGGRATLAVPAEVSGDKVSVQVTVVDRFSVVGKLDYTIDSNSEWKAAVPTDLVYDTTSEDFTIELEKLEPGEHILALRAKDDLGNTAYKTIELKVTEK